MRAEREALDRLRERYQRPGSGYDAMLTVVLASQRDDRIRKLVGDPEPTAQDALDGLAQARDARQAVDHTELSLIHLARSMGSSWEDIGQSLGLDGKDLARSARRRYDALSRQFPGFMMGRNEQ